MQIHMWGFKMKEKTCDNIRIGHTLIAVLGITALALLMLVGIAGAAPFAYISNVNDDTVSVIDTATNTVTATVSVESHPCGVAVRNIQDSTVVEVTQLAQINTSLQKGPVFLKIGAEWCRPCLEMKPILKDLATEYAGKVTIMSVDIDKSPELKNYFGVEYIPDCSVIVDIENGKYVYMQQNGKTTNVRSQARIIGLDDKKAFEDVLNLALSIKPPDAGFTWKYVDSKKQTVMFIDESTNSPTSWHWKFGDGTCSREQNPTHTYKQINKEYPVTLTVRNEAGRDTAKDSVPVGPMPP